MPQTAAMSKQKEPPSLISASELQLYSLAGGFAFGGIFLCLSLCGRIPLSASPVVGQQQLYQALTTENVFRHNQCVPSVGGRQRESKVAPSS